ncbi:hypothetical protein SDC9_159234 [bioreactor metagenome]|uniref:DUF669 domain-containing protein n=1 Tax=bioreactor metagenome TaxID=1076179 RepID=A0A645FC29_9ZZZZ
MSTENERALGWDDEIEKESEFILLPDGDYNFEVTAFERARHAGSANLPPCNKAVISLKVYNDNNSTTIKHNLFLHTKTEGMLSEFFKAIGQKKHGEKLRMNWNAVIGSKGRCKVFIDNYKNDKGEDRQSNKIKRFYEPDNSTAQPPQNNTGAYQTSFTPGTF